MPYDNDYNQRVANEIDSMNRKYVLNQDITLSHPAMAKFSGSGKLEGGFLGALAGAVLPMVLNSLMGKGYSGGANCECESVESLQSDSENEDSEKEGKGMSGGAMYNHMRDKMEGMGKASKDYKKQSEEKYMCGLGMSGGSAFGAQQGSVRDTGEGVVVPKNIMGSAKKRGRKSKMGSGLSGGAPNKDQALGFLARLTKDADKDAVVKILDELQLLDKSGIVHKMKERFESGEFSLEESKKALGMYLRRFAGYRGGRKKKMEGAGIISDLGIPIVSNLAGMFGLGKSGGARGGENPIKPETFYPKHLGKSAVSADKSVPADVVPMMDKNVLRGSNMSGMGKKKASKKASPKAGGKKANPWMELMAKVRKEHPELKGVKAVADYIKKNNLYKK